MGNANSGKRKDKSAIRKSIAGLSQNAINTIKAIMKDETAPASTRLQAAQYLVDQDIGKATQSHALEDELMQNTRELLEKWQSARKVMVSDQENISANPRLETD